MSKRFRTLTVVLLACILFCVGFMFAQRAMAAETYNLVVNFLFSDNTIAYDPFTATIDAGADYSTHLTFPSIQGYLPYIEDDDTSSADMTINLTDVHSNQIITIWYKPAQVSYRVDHYLQNINDDDYTLYESDTLIGYTHDRPQHVENDYVGFYALVYESPEIAADGSTIVRVYYDRYYYLMNFVTNGGVGAEPIYDKYGASVTAPTPTRAGYTFNGWSPSVPSTIPVDGGTYTANWTPTTNGTTYTVLYLYENIDDAGYTTVATKAVTATAEATVNSSAHQNDTFTGRNATFFTYNSAMATTITVAGDGSSFLPVYFSRNVINYNFRSNGGTITTISGKYQSSFANNNVAWPSNTNGYMWRIATSSYNGTGSWMTFLAAFLPTDDMGTASGDPGHNYYFVEQSQNRTGPYIYFYTQNIDGTYNVAMTPYETYADVYTQMSSSGSTFTVSNKFPGFSVQDYRTYSNNAQQEVYFTDPNGDEYFGVRYQTTTATTGTQYGVVNGQFVQLVEIPSYSWETQYTYTSTTSTSNQDYYGVINGEYNTLVRIRYYIYTEYTGTPAEGNSSYYGWYQNNFVTVYYHNGSWYRTRSGWFNYTYTNEYTGTVYARAQDNNYHFYYAGTQYTGTRYTRSNTNSSYTGTRYTRSGSSAPYTYTATTTTTIPEGGLYGLVNGGYIPLDRVTGGTSIYQYNGENYTGTRYAVSTATTAGTYYGVDNGSLITLTWQHRTSNWSTWTNTSVDAQLTINANTQIRFVRAENTLSFYNYDDYDTVHQAVVMYQANLGQYYYVPDYPSGLPYGKYTFAGWYDNSECLGSPFDFANSEMPMNALTLFAKWAPKTFTVEVYENIANLRNGTNLLESHSIPYNNLCPAPTVPSSSYTFIGWFYEDEQRNEHPFPFSVLPVTQNIKVYGKWTSHTLVPYTIHYQLADGTPVANDVSSYALAGSSKTFWASTMLYSAYDHGYFPASASHSMVFELESTNEYTFVYYYLDAAPYTVQYLDAITEQRLMPDKVVNDNDSISVTEHFAPIANYVPDHFQKSILISALEPEKNVIIFYYTQDTQHAYYLVSHYIESSPGLYTLYNALDVFEDIGEVVSATPLTIPGYTYNSSITGTVTSGTVTASGLELKLYYEANDYPYVIRYLNANTSAVLAPAYNGTAKYHSTVTANAIAISGYRISGNSTKSIVIDIDTVGDVVRNVITFYYIINDATINYTVTPVGGGTVTRTSEHLNPETSLAQGTTATPTAGWVFVGWFANAAGTTPISSTVATVSGNTIIPQKYDNGNGQTIYHDDTFYAVFRQQLGNLTISKRVNGLDAYTGSFTFHLTMSNMTNETITVTGDLSSITFSGGTATFSLKHNESITISDIPAGVTYSLTENDYTTDGFRTTVDNPSGTIADLTTTTVNVINTFVSVVAPMGNNNSRVLMASLVILCAGALLLGTGVFVKKRFLR